MRLLLGIAEHDAERGRRCSWQYRFVRFRHVHFRAEVRQFARNHVARHLGTHQQHALSFHLASQGFHHRFGYVLVRDDINRKSMGLDYPRGCRADGSDIQVEEVGLGFAELGQARKEHLHAVGAGQDKPVVIENAGDGAVERRP